MEERKEGGREGNTLLNNVEYLMPFFGICAPRCSEKNMLFGLWGLGHKRANMSLTCV